jgi:hypothetical protein
MCSNADPLAELHRALSGVARSEPGLCERPLRAAALAREAARVKALYLQELGALDASGELALDGAPSTVSWVRRTTGQSQRQAADDVQLARRLRRLPVLAAAFLAGDLQERTVDLVARVALQLPEELVAETEPALVDAARLMSYDELRRYLKERVAALAPERLKDAVRSAWEQRRLHVDQVGDVAELRALMDPLDAELLDNVLQALVESDRRSDETRTTAQRRYDAFLLLLQLACEQPDMPRVREALPQLVIVKEEARPAHTTGGNVLTKGQLDLVACTGVRTEVLVDSARQPLGVGRSSRSLSRRLWLAVVVRDDGHCQVAGCTTPAPRCVPHHIVPWRLGGPTDLPNLVLLCVAHHHALHDRDVNLLLYDGRLIGPTGPAMSGSPPSLLRV